MYLYVDGNPLVGIDPAGLTCETISFPINFDYSSDDNWGEWSKWSYDFYHVEGGAWGTPFFVLRCICKRNKSGTNTTKLDIIWQHLQVCSSCGIPYTNDWKTTENVYTRQKPLKDSDSKTIWGGYVGNEASAPSICGKKCDQLN